MGLIRRKDNFFIEKQALNKAKVSDIPCKIWTPNAGSDIS
jgi:hypothetical protein